MSRPQKIHKPLKGDFNSILAAVGMGSGTGKKAARRLVKEPVKPQEIILSANEREHKETGKP